MASGINANTLSVVLFNPKSKIRGDRDLRLSLLVMFEVDFPRVGEVGEQFGGETESGGIVVD